MLRSPTGCRIKSGMTEAVYLIAGLIINVLKFQLAPTIMPFPKSYEALPQKHYLKSYMVIHRQYPKNTQPHNTIMLKRKTAKP